MRKSFWSLDSPSGPHIARLFHTVLALLFVVAFASLGAQIELLIGSRGLLPLAPFVESIAAEPTVNWWDFPTLFWIASSDAVLVGGIALGIVVAALAAAGVYPRVGFALLVILYLSYASACRDFMSFQWDNLLLECGLLAVLLPRHRTAPWIHFLCRVLLFKLYWESGLAKWNSPIGDWIDGSAMAFYYETAPIPTALAWWAHNLPEIWHTFESRTTLVLELIVPLLAFGPRATRLTALVALTGFQVANAATANYGFFCFLSVALHLFLLDERDVERFIRRPLRAGRSWGKRARHAGRAVAIVIGTTYFVLSGVEGVRLVFPGQLPEPVESVRRAAAPFRLANSYHLFASVTRERVEPEFQVRTEGGWTPLTLRFKPGPLERPPPVVAPHHPRVDFQLWFYGLSYRRGLPLYVGNLLERLCHDPGAVAPLFVEVLPEAPSAVRIAFSRYRFTNTRAAPAYWTRESLRKLPPLVCGQ